VPRQLRPALLYLLHPCSRRNYDNFQASPYTNHTITQKTSNVIIDLGKRFLQSTVRYQGLVKIGFDTAAHLGDRQ